MKHWTSCILFFAVTACCPHFKKEDKSYEPIKKVENSKKIIAKDKLPWQYIQKHKSTGN
jgi:hypothetical protein